MRKQQKNSRQTSAFLACDNLTFFYPEDTHPTLSDISFSVCQGEIMVVCGESGCGKTTLLRHMKKNQMPFGEKQGRITLGGRNLEEMPLRESTEIIGFVGQNPQEQLVTDTVWHELAFAMENLGYSPAVIRKKTAEIAEYFGIGNLFRKKVSALSGGQQQILNLASVMVLKPELLVLDEPTAQLDPISGERFLQILSQLNQDFGITILMAEQHLEQVLPMADKVLLLHQGKNMAVGGVRELPGLLRHAAPKEGKPLPVKDALPVALRVYLEAARTRQPEEETPISVREGRLWLHRQELSKAEERKVLPQKEKGRKKERYALEAKSVTYSYAPSEKNVLENFSVKIPEGEIYGLVGGNGSGKTTALKVLSGIYSPLRGKIKSRGRVLYLAQNPKSIFTEITVWEELGEAFETFGRERKKTPKSVEISVDDKKKKIEETLEWLELTGQREQNPMDLSGGQQQRLALGKILLMEPDVLLLDEPTKGMDAGFKAKFSAYLQELSREGMTIVLVSHDLEFCARNTTHCGLLFDGALISSGETRGFFEESTFYTTQAKRMTEGILPHCILWEDIVRQIGGDG